LTEDIVETMKRFAFGAEQQNARDAVSGLLAAADEITRLRAALAQRIAAALDYIRDGGEDAHYRGDATVSAILRGEAIL
jgi:hypothetical protein